MKFKRFVYVGLVLGVGLLGCYIAWQQQVKSFPDKLRPPSADQVRQWAGLSERTHLTVFTNIPDDVWYGDYDLHPGKFKWVRAYEDRKGSNLDCFVIAVYESGAFWPTNRAKFINDLEYLHKKIVKDQTKETGAFAKERAAMAEAIGPMIMPNGKKSYGFIIGLDPARFALGPKFDILAYEFVYPMSYEESHPPANPTEMPTNSFYQFFTNVDAFLSSQ